MKILVTGGAGFVGSHVVERCTSRGDQIVAIDNFSTGRRDNLAPRDGLKIIEGSIADAKLVRDAFSAFKPDYVVHAAASYKDPDNWIEDTNTNVLGTANVVQAARAEKVRRIVYFQTALCYGLRPVEQPVTLNHALYPDGSSYAISKTAGEQYIVLGGVDFISFRLANIIGPRNLSGPVATFYSRLTSGKACFVMDTRRDFVFVNDLVDIVMKALEGKGASGFYHVASGRDYSIKEIFDATVAAMGITLKQPVEQRQRGPDDVFSILLDPSKTNKDFDWRVTTSLEQSVQKAVEWYRKHGVAQAYTHLKLEEKKS